MILRSLIQRSTIAVALLLSATAVMAKGDAEAGKAKSTVCQACHGADGNGTGDGQYPRIAGQYADYLAKSLMDYKNGARANPIMAGFAATLSEEDIANLAEYYAQQESPLHDLSHLK